MTDEERELNARISEMERECMKLHGQICKREGCANRITYDYGQTVKKRNYKRGDKRDGRIPRGC